MWRDTISLKFLGVTQNYDNFLLRNELPNDRRRVFQYCCECLALDKQPYLRSEWKSALVTHCLKHSSLLQQNCPTCKQPITVSRACGQALDKCFSCLSSLSSSERDKTNILGREYSRYQEELYRLFRCQTFTLFQTTTFINFLSDCARVFEGYRRRSLFINYAKQAMDIDLKPLSRAFVVATPRERYAAQTMMLQTKYKFTSPNQWG
jgi:TniQ